MNGLLVQWGWYRATHSDNELYFAIAFSSVGSYSIIPISDFSNGGGANEYPIVTKREKAYAKIANGCYENGWIAIGY